MYYLKTNNLLVVSIVLFSVALCFAEKSFEYKSIGVRDPMVKPIALIENPVVRKSKKDKIKKENENRRKELKKIISQSKIEGVVFGKDNKPFLMIDDKIVSEGKRISKKANVYAVKIELKKVVFSLDNEMVTYVFSPIKKDED